MRPQLEGELGWSWKQWLIGGLVVYMLVLRGILLVHGWNQAQQEDASVAYSHDICMNQTARKSGAMNNRHLGKYCQESTEVLQPVPVRAFVYMVRYSTPCGWFFLEFTCSDLIFHATGGGFGTLLAFIILSVALIYLSFGYLRGTRQDDAYTQAYYHAQALAASARPNPSLTHRTTQGLLPH